MERMQRKSERYREKGKSERRGKMCREKYERRGEDGEQLRQMEKQR